MSDDRPLSSEEMIKQAREELKRPPQRLTFDSDLDAVEEDLIGDEQQPRRSSAAATRRLARPSRIPRDPFGSRTQRANQTRPITLVISLALGIIGIAMALAFIAANAP